MKKISLCVMSILLCSFVLGTVPTVFAEETNFTYITIGGTVTIIGCSGDATDIIVPDRIDNKPVTAIAANAFRGKAELTSVFLPASVETIGSYAFAGCSSIGNINILSKSVVIGAYAFSDCAALSSVMVSGTVKELGNAAFYNCAGLLDVSCGKGIQKIGKYAFRGCSSLVDMDLKQTTAVGAYAFMGCTQLTSVVTGKTLKTIGKNVFYDTSDKLEIVVVKGSKALTYVRKNKLSYRYADGTLLEDEEVTYKKGNYKIIRSHKTKGTCMFLGTKESTPVSFTIPDVIKVNGISYKVVEIKDYAFFSSKKLRKVTIGKNVKTIGSGAFAYCDKLTSVVIKGTHLTTVESDAFEYSRKAKISVPKAKAAAYRKLIKR